MSWWATRPLRSRRLFKLKWARRRVRYAAEQRGTGDAVLAARAQLENKNSLVPRALG